MRESCKKEGVEVGYVRDNDKEGNAPPQRRRQMSQIRLALCTDMTL